MSAQSSALAAAYTCRLCRQTLTLQGPPIIGEQRLVRVSEMLVEHLGQNHRNEMAKMTLQGNQIAGWLYIEQFKHNDNELAAETNGLRLALRRHMKRVNVTDELIEQQVKTFFQEMTADQQGRLAALLKTLRDTLDEVQPG